MKVIPGEDRKLLLLVIVFGKLPYVVSQAERQRQCSVNERCPGKLEAQSRKFSSFIYLFIFLFFSYFIFTSKGNSWQFSVHTGKEVLFIQRKKKENEIKCIQHLYLATPWGKKKRRWTEHLLRANFNHQINLHKCFVEGFWTN